MSPATVNNSPTRTAKAEVLILLYSSNAKLRSILAAGLRQCSYKIIETESDRMTTVKANQYKPALTIIDLANNPSNLKIISGLLMSNRTRNTPMVIIGNTTMNSAWNKLLLNLRKTHGQTIDEQIQFAVFPFKFSGLLEPIQELLKSDASPFCSGPTGGEVDEDIEEKLFDPETSNQSKLDIIIKSIKKQWAFPQTVFQAMKIANSERSGTRDLGKCIKTDSAASAAILKIANTVFYAKSSGKFDDVIQAVVRLGFRETRNLLSSMALINLSAGPDKSYGFSRTDFWMHSLSTGVIAELLCKKAQSEMSDMAFITALVHDLGKVPLDNNFNLVLSRILDKSTSDVIPFPTAEKSLMGFTHADCGKFLMDNWNFPPAISQGVFNHHKPQSILATRRKEEKIMQGCVFAANIFSKALSLGHSTDECLPQIPQQILNDIQIPDGPSEEFFIKVRRELEVLVKYLKIADDKFKMEIDQQKDQESKDIAVIYDQKVFFHPMLLALNQSGYNAVHYREGTDEVKAANRVIIYFPKKGEAFEPSIDKNDQPDTGGEKMLEIFLTENPPETDTAMGDPQSGTYFLSSKSSDYFTLLKALNNFFDISGDDNESEGEDDNEKEKNLEENQNNGQPEDEEDDDDDLFGDEDLFRD